MNSAAAEWPRSQHSKEKFKNPWLVRWPEPIEKQCPQDLPLDSYHYLMTSPSWLVIRLSRRIHKLWHQILREFTD